MTAAGLSALLLIPLAWGCAATSPPKPLTRKAPSSWAADYAFDRQQWEQMNQRLKEKGPHDPLIWETGVAWLNSDNVLYEARGGLLLNMIASKDRKLIPKVLDISRQIARKPGALRKQWALNCYRSALWVKNGHQLFGKDPAYGGDPMMSRAARAEDIAARGRLSDRDKKYVVNCLRYDDSSAVSNALSVMLKTVELPRDDLAWAQSEAAKMIEKTAGDKKEYWRLVLEALKA